MTQQLLKESHMKGKFPIQILQIYLQEYYSNFTVVAF